MHKRTVLQVLIALYILFSLWALGYTMLRWRSPFWPVTRYFYGMMAPYQSYQTSNYALVAEGLTASHEWMPIDLDPYLPFIRGERETRTTFISFRNAGADLPEIHRRYAERIRSAEAHRGRNYERIRLWLDAWPRSPGGYAFLRLEPFVTRTLLTETP